MEKRKEIKKVVKDKIKVREKFIVFKYRNDEDYKKGKYYEKSVDICDSELNCLLNAGITEMLNLMIGASALHFDNANAQIGVGNSNAAAVATQTDLQGGSTAWSVMDVTFPNVTNQKITFQGDFGSAEANFHWEECAVRYGAVGAVFNRVVADKGTKVAGETWVARDEVTLS